MEGVREVVLSNGMVALVDEVDWEAVRRYRWHALSRMTTRHGRAYRYGAVAWAKSCGKKIYLHRLITQAPEGKVVDHINGDTLDNRRTNLRVCTHLQNRSNNNLSRNNKSGFAGVSFHKAKQRWKATIHVEPTNIHIGWFASAEDAARAYDRAALEWRGPYARLNFQLDPTAQDAKAFLLDARPPRSQA